MMVLRFPALALTGALAVAVAHPRVDATRHQRAIDEALMFVPDGETLRVASTGFAEALADLVWVRVILIFGERYDTQPGQQWREWVRRMVLAVNTLDPAWRTAYYYGGVFARVSGDIDGSDEIFHRGMESLPGESFFPFSIGMNAYLHRQDPGTAADYIERACHCPNAPSWYCAASAAMRADAGDRGTAIRFLRELRASTANEAIRQDSERQLDRLFHDDIVDRWDEACRDWMREHGRPLSRPEDVALLGFELPANPRHDAWVVSGDGVVRSKAADQERLRDLRTGEWKLILP